MKTTEIARSLRTLVDELLEGAPTTGAYMLNRGDQGLLRSLDRLDASAASRINAAGSSIAAHVDHLSYGLSLLNRWAAGENPWTDADWTVSWRRTSVSDAEWTDVRAALREEARRWATTIGSPRDVNEMELKGIIGSIGHLAYHMGAIRQMNRDARGPSAESERA